MKILTIILSTIVGCLGILALVICVAVNEIYIEIKRWWTQP